MGDRAESIVGRLLPDSWICRKIPKDYGVDMEVELVDGDTVTGARIWLQIKGVGHLRRASEVPFSVIRRPPAPTDSPPRKRVCVIYPVETALLTYALRCDFPLLLVVVELSSERAFWLPLRDYIECVLASDHPWWAVQQKIKVCVPVENEICATNGNDFEGLRWYALEMARMRAFCMLSRYYEWSSILCQRLRQIVQSVEEFQFPAQAVQIEFARAATYLHYAIETDCVFGKRGIDWFQKTNKARLQNGLTACAAALSHAPLPYQHLRQLAAAAVSALDDLRTYAFIYEALRRRFLFSDEQCLSDVLREQEVP